MLDINLLRKDLAHVVAAARDAQDAPALSRRRTLPVARSRAQGDPDPHRGTAGAPQQPRPSRSASSRPRASDVAATDGRGRRHRRRAEGLGRAARGDPGRAVDALLMARAQPAARQRAGRRRRARQRRGAPLGHAARASTFTPSDHVDLGAPLGLDFDTGAKLSRLALQLPARAGRAAAPRARAVHARPADAASTATPSATRPTSSTARSSRAPASCRSSRTTCSGSSRRRRRASSAEQYLISTSEISLTNTVREQVLAETELPIKLTAHSPCFR